MRDEFEDAFFFFRGKNKEKILKELDLYNINEATLFPELEHQLNYIKYITAGSTQVVTDFSKYEEHSKIGDVQWTLNDDMLNTYILSNLSNILKGIAKPNEIDELKNIIQSNFTVDWYNRSTIISKMRMAISGYYFVKYKDKTKAKETAIKISDLLNDAVGDYAKTNQERSE